jgi:hypothetical protein
MQPKNSIMFFRPKLGFWTGINAKKKFFEFLIPVLNPENTNYSPLVPVCGPQKLKNFY